MFEPVEDQVSATDYYSNYDVKYNKQHGYYYQQQHEEDFVFTRTATSENSCKESSTSSSAQSPSSESKRPSNDDHDDDDHDGEGDDGEDIVEESGHVILSAIIQIVARTIAASTESTVPMGPMGPIGPIGPVIAPHIPHIQLCSICDVDLSNLCPSCNVPEQSFESAAERLQHNLQLAQCTQLSGECGHTFHNHCIMTFMTEHTSCPNCDDDFSPVPIV
jgi:hypothetical protein